MNASAVAATAQPTADIHLASKVAEQQLNASYMVSALFSQHQQHKQQQNDTNNYFSVTGIPSDSNLISHSLSTAPSSISSSLSTPSCSSSNLFQQSTKDSPLLFNGQFNSLATNLNLNQTTSSPPMQSKNSNPCLFNLPVMFLTMPSTSDPSATAYIINQQQQQQQVQTTTANNSLVDQRSAVMQFNNTTALTTNSQASPDNSGPLHLPAVPKCSICGADSTGIHFGVEACAACSAFFRRTVVLSKNYVCPKDGKCPFNHGEFAIIYVFKKINFGKKLNFTFSVVCF